MATFSGVWLPIITPFIDGEIDYAGYEKLIDHYLRAGVAGIIPLGTTGESPTIDEVEAETLVERTVAAVAGRVPVLVGVGANDTRKAVKAVKRLGRQSVQGILSVCPYYNRPSQDGMREHFTRIAEATDRPILIYNIPYRTGVNLTNETLLALAELPNIVGVKDSSGIIAQSLRGRLLLHEARPRRGRRHPRLLARRDRALPGRLPAHGGERSSRRACRLARARDARAPPLQGAEPHAHQALLVAAGADPVTRVPPPPDARLRGSRARARPRAHRRRESGCVTRRQGSILAVPSKSLTLHRLTV